MLRSTFLLNFSCRYLGSKWGGPCAVLTEQATRLSLRGEAIHELDMHFLRREGHISAVPVK